MTASNPVNLVKARLRNVGDGVLEFTDDAVKFYVETGRFRKQRKMVREIPFVDVESVERQENDLHVTWKGTIETFTVKQSSQVDAIYEKITSNLPKPKNEPEIKVAADEKRIELTLMTINAMETAYSLFSILKNLHGRVDWKLVENSYKQSEECAGRLAAQSTSPLSLDVKPLSLAVLERRAKETAEQTLSLLKALYDEFNDLASSANDSGQLQPTPRVAQLMIRVVYVVNDMLLSAVVGDKEIAKEGAELLKVIDDLAKLRGSKIDIAAVKSSLDKLCVENDAQELPVEEVRSILEQQLKELLTSEAESEQPKGNSVCDEKANTE